MSTPPNQPDDKPTATHASEARRPWYASSWVIIVYSAFLLVIFCIIGFIPYSGTFMDAVRKTFQGLNLQSVPAETPSVDASPTAPVADSASTCVIVWVEHQPDDLGKKSRARVYEQFVSDEVKATGMTPREFYELVAEHNPELINDDYEFKKGKKYLLPECQ